MPRQTHPTGETRRRTSGLCAERSLVPIMEALRKRRETNPGDSLVGASEQPFPTGMGGEVLHSVDFRSKCYLGIGSILW